jgi:hypothetical protein
LIISDNQAVIIKRFIPWLSSPLIIRLCPYLDYHESVILQKTSLKGLILIIKSTYQPWYVPLRLTNEASVEQLRVRASTAPRYVKPQALDQLEEWIKENPIPYISSDKFSQEDISLLGWASVRARSCQPNVPWCR